MISSRAAYPSPGVREPELQACPVRADSGRDVVDYRLLERWTASQRLYAETRRSCVPPAILHSVEPLLDAVLDRVQRRPEEKLRVIELEER